MDITRTFAGFTSLCIIPRLCRYCRALAVKRKKEKRKFEVLSSNRNSSKPLSVRRDKTKKRLASHPKEVAWMDTMHS